MFVLEGDYQFPQLATTLYSSYYKLITQKETGAVPCALCPTVAIVFLLLRTVLIFCILTVATHHSHVRQKPSILLYFHLFAVHDV